MSTITFKDINEKCKLFPFLVLKYTMLQVLRYVCTHVSKTSKSCSYKCHPSLWSWTSRNPTTGVVGSFCPHYLISSYRLHYFAGNMSCELDVCIDSRILCHKLCGENVAKTASMTSECFENTKSMRIKVLKYVSILPSFILFILFKLFNTINVSECFCQESPTSIEWFTYWTHFLSVIWCIS